MNLEIASVQKKKRGWLAYAYYILLLAILLSWTGSSAPNEILRVLFVIALFVPTVFKETFWIPTALICFFTTSQYLFAFPLMPTTHSIYIVILLILALFFYRKTKNAIFPSGYVLFIVYVLLVDLLTSYNVNQIFTAMVISLLLFGFIDLTDKNAVRALTLAFIVASLALSSMFLLNRDDFVQDQGFYGGLERSGWTDQNYFGMILGFGAVLALNLLLSNERKTIYEKIICIASVALTTVALVLNASRGAILSTFAAYISILFFSKTAMRYKVLFSIVAVSFLIYLLNNQYFELLQYRIENDDGGGSGRTGIWEMKWGVFSSSDNVLKYLFGYGYKGGIGIGGHIGFHNDFIAVLVEYGLIGLVMFLALFIRPILKTSSQNKFFVGLLVFYMFVCFCTLEPMTLGVLPFWFFYIYICVVSNQQTAK